MAKDILAKDTFEYLIRIKGNNFLSWEYFNHLQKMQSFELFGKQVGGGGGGA